MEIAIVGLIALGSFLLGAVFLIGYILYRMMGNEGWDDSNITNALRLLSHVTLHSEDFAKMYYLTEHQKYILGKEITFLAASLKRPFWYVAFDELKEVVKTRP